MASGTASDSSTKSAVSELSATAVKYILNATANIREKIIIFLVILFRIACPFLSLLTRRGELISLNQ